MIKPEFFDDPVIAELTPMARLFYIGLWLQADKAGRLPDDPRRLKARIFPYESVDCDVLAAELDTLRLIRRYLGSDDRRYIWIRTFVKHQRPHPKEPESLIPPFGEKHGEPWKKTEGTSESGSLILDSGIRNLESGKRNLEDGVKNTPPPQNLGLQRVARNGRRMNGSSNKLILNGIRLKVFDWFLDDAEQILGPQHYQEFDIHQWLNDLDQHASRTSVVIPHGALAPWLKTQLVAEAGRRGLPIAMLDAPAKPHKHDVRDAEVLARMKART